MKIFNYLEFLTEEAKERGIFKISKDFKSKLQKVYTQFRDDVANSILDLEGSEQEFTYVNLTDKSDKISYIDISRVKYFIDKIYEKSNRSDSIPPLNTFIRSFTLRPENPTVLTNDYYGIKVSFTEISIGRFVKKLLLDKFKDHQISTFVERWLSTSDSGRFEVWGSDQVLKAYNSSNYEELSGSILDNSCMNDLSYVNFYRGCPGVKILVLLDEEDDSIKGRCLLWDTIDGKKVMDRVYYNTADDYYKFVKWGKDNGYYIRDSRLSYVDHFIFGDDVVQMKFKVKFPNIEEYRNENFPYIDTFYYSKDGFGMNYRPEDPGRYYSFHETDGTFEEYYNIDPKQKDMSDNENW